MLAKHFYNETIKNAVSVFGSLFNNIVIRRRDGKVLPVPIAYGPRQKWAEAHKAMDREEEMFEKLLPRMSYEMVSMQYDANRKITNKRDIAAKPTNNDDPRQTTSSPVPYNIDFSLYLETKTLNDGWQVLEQILPHFTPSYTVRVRHFPVDADLLTKVPTNTFDMPFTLTSLSWVDDWTGEISDRRTIEWTLEFSTKVWMHGATTDVGIILDSRVILSTPNEIGVDIHTMNRTSSQVGNEVGWVAADSDVVFFDNDSDLSPHVINTIDSDGHIVRIVRPINEI